MTIASVPLSFASTARAHDVRAKRLDVLHDAMTAIYSGDWARAATALAREPEIARHDAACLNLIGVVCQARQRWRRAQRFYGKAMRADHTYGPAEQNVRRLYELQTFGRTTFPVALLDAATMRAVREHRPTKRSASPAMSHSIPANATMDDVNGRLDWEGFAWAIGSVVVATAIGWPLVHRFNLHFAETNVLMLYLLGVLWVATRHSRSAAIVASVLGVAVFDFVFVRPYYTFAVADRQYLITFAVMLLTALVISTLTHRVRRQSELAHQAWQRVETEFLRNTLLSSVSHDLRTPLSAISGAASTLSESDVHLTPGARGELVEIITSESARMERLINNLLDMTRMEAGGLSLNKEWLPVQEVIGAALANARSRLNDRVVNVKIDPAAPMIHADGTLIGQVLANLIDNAIEYAPASAAIDIDVTSHERDVTIEVSDRGPGFPAGTEQRVFDKFFRARPDETRRGIGLGLAIVKGIVEAHGGRVSASNRAGGGATVRFVLPTGGLPPPHFDTSC